MKRKFKAVKGTRDILPESALWNASSTARQVFAAYNFHEIRPPIFEEYEVFARSVGLDTDIVSKEMYTLEDRDGSVLALRPEATAQVCRAYIEHGMHTWPSPVKLYYLGPIAASARRKAASASFIRSAPKSSAPPTILPLTPRSLSW
jgi:histidyl-tRNA synthetase